MHLIEIYVESHWSFERPKLSFYINDKKLKNGHCVLHKKSDLYTEYLIYKFITKDEFNNSNCLKINLSEKTNDLVTESCDHWASIKNIFIDGIGADWLLYTNTKFIHNMPTEWVEEMKNQNIEIHPEYSPGTEMRLNGTTEFYFDSPFWLYKVKEIEKR